MKKEQVIAELNEIRSKFCNGAKVHEFNKTCIAVELAASYCDANGDIMLENNVQDLLKKLSSLTNR
jgi:hypothetical protein